MNPCCNYCWNAYYVSVIDGKHIGICEKCRTKKTLTRKERDDYVLFQEMSRPCGDCPGNCYFEKDNLRFRCGSCSSKKYITRDEYSSMIERAKSKIAEFEKLQITMSTARQEMIKSVLGEIKSHEDKVKFIEIMDEKVRRASKVLTEVSNSDYCYLIKKTKAEIMGE